MYLRHRRCGNLAHSSANNHQHCPLVASLCLLTYQLSRLQAKNECVQVVVRCRPMSKKEKAGGDFKSVVDVYPLRGVIEIQHPGEANRDSAKMFTYDAVYDKQ